MFQDLWSARRGVAIDVSSTDQDATNNSQPGRGVYISTAGNLVVRLSGDTANTTFTGVLAGTVYSFSIAKVIKIGTTAAGVILY